MGNSMEFMPLNTLRRNVQNWLEDFHSEKNNSPSKQNIHTLQGSVMLYSFSLFHENICGKHCNLFSSIISPASSPMRKLSETLLEKSISQRTPLINKIHYNKFRGPFWYYIIPAELLVAFFLFKFKTIWNRDLECWYWF